MYVAGVPLTLTSGFVSGQNTLRVRSSGGSNGVYVNVTQPTTPPLSYRPDRLLWWRHQS